jgi:hypothetical protein
MKKLNLTFVLLAFLSISSISKATVRTVSNWANIPAQFTVIQSAISASAEGDTVYVHGSPNIYSNFEINKRLTIIGPGYFPQFQNQNKAEVSQVFIYSTVAGSVNNINIIGLYVTSQIYAGYNIGTFAVGVPMEGLRVNRSFVAGLSNPLSGAPSSSLIVEQSVFTSTLNTDNFASVLVNNTIFANSRISSSNSTDANTVVTNCLFYGNSSGPQNITNTIFSNNIFYRCTSFGNQTGCTYNRNLTFATDNNTLSFSGAITSNTIGNTDPLFVTTYSTAIYGNGAPTQPNPFFNDGNLLLQASSPAIGQGTDNTDIGPSGGTANFNYRTQSMSAIPQMVSLIINNSTLPQNGTLNVQFSGQRQN